VVVLRRDTGQVVIRQQPHLGRVTTLSIDRNARSKLIFASGDESGGVYIHSWDAKSQQTETKVGHTLILCYHACEKSGC